MNKPQNETETATRGNTSGHGQGDYFAVDRRAWAKAASLGTAAATAYLVLARGTGPDQRSTSWSIQAIETHTGVSRPRAKTAVAALEQHGLLRVEQGGTRPRYRIIPAHEVPGCEGCPPPPMDPTEQLLAGNFTGGHLVLDNQEFLKEFPEAHSVIIRMVEKGHIKNNVNGSYTLVIYNKDSAIKPDWIWLPNTLIDGAAQETAPIELVRQCQDLVALRLLVDLYHVHSLAAEGEIDWRHCRREFKAVCVGQRGIYTVLGFKPTDWYFAPTAPFVAAQWPRNTATLGNMSKTQNGESKAFRAAWELLLDLRLIEVVPHLIEADTPDAEIIHPCGFGSPGISGGEPAEGSMGQAAYLLSAAMVTERQLLWSQAQKLWLVPVLKRQAQAQMIGIARLRYRPRTSATTAWYARMPMWSAMADKYEVQRAELERIKSQKSELRARHQ